MEMADERQMVPPEEVDAPEAPYDGVLLGTADCDDCGSPIIIIGTPLGHPLVKVHLDKEIAAHLINDLAGRIGMRTH